MEKESQARGILGKLQKKNEQRSIRMVWAKTSVLICEGINYIAIPHALSAMKIKV